MTRRLLVVGLAVLGAAGCGEDVVQPDTGTPLVWLVLNATTATADGDTVQPAFLLRTTSGPNPAYRGASRFELRRAVDGAVHTFRARPRDGAVRFDRTTIVQLSEANFVLPVTSSAGGPGVDSLRPGRRYRLVVEGQGFSLRGEVAVPGRFEARVRRVEEGIRVAWSPSEGAAAYHVHAPGTFVRTLEPVRDTTVELQDRSPSGEPLPAGTEVVVRALDPNLVAYMTQRSVDRAGVEGGLGVLGALTADTVEVPEE